MRIRLIFLLTFSILKAYCQVGNDSLLSTPLNDSSKLNGITLPLNYSIKVDSNKFSKEKISNKFDEAKQNLNLNKDSLLSQSKTGLKDAKPKAKTLIKKQLSSLKPIGTISFGYDYGVLPYVVGTTYPAEGFKTEGNISVLLLGLPVEVMFYYTNVKNVIGLNNYFRVSYDANRYKDMMGQKMSAQEKEMRNKFNDLQLQQQQLQKKMEFLGLAKQNIYNQQQTPGYNYNINPNSYNSFQPNTTSLPYQTIDSSSVTDSLTRYNTYSNKSDSLSNEYNEYKQKYDSINKLIIDTKAKMEQIQNLNNNDPSSMYNPYLSKYQNILKTIKKLDIGLCSPNYSTFLLNNIPLQGINIELEKNNNFLGITYGTTINNLLFNTNTLQGSIQGARNLYNYFDFGNLAAGRKVFAIKGGIGSKEQNHLHIGALIGKGRTDYLLPSIDLSSNNNSIESNLVFEIDGKLVVSKKLSFDLIYGKSSVKEGDLNAEQLGKAVNEIFSNYRSNAALFRTTLGIEKSKTKIILTTRWIDPFFKSFGLGFIRSDNMRYELKLDQPLGKKLKYTLAFRREEDNLLRLYDYKNVLYSINNSLNIKINRQFNIRLIYAPLFRELRTGSTTIKDQNNISTIIVSFTPRPKKVTAQLNALYSRYLITGDSSNINFENLTYTQQFLFKSGFSTGLNVSWFKNNLNDSLNNDTYLGVADIGYRSKKNHSVTLGGKCAYKSGNTFQYGFLIKSSIHVYKGLYWEAQAEKILIGDYYNSFVNSHIEDFPYYLTTKLTLQF